MAFTAIDTDSRSNAFSGSRQQTEGGGVVARLTIILNLKHILYKDFQPLFEKGKFLLWPFVREHFTLKFKA